MRLVYCGAERCTIMVLNKGMMELVIHLSKPFLVHSNKLKDSMISYLNLCREVEFPHFLLAALCDALELM